MARNEESSLISSNLDLFRTGLYSDLTVKCQAREWKIHRSVVCPRALFFERACKAGFQEGNSGMINLPSDDPIMIERLLTFLYSLDYDAAMSDEGGRGTEQLSYDAQDTSNLSAELNIHVAMYTLADRFIIPSLKAVATSKFSAAIQGAWPVQGFPQIAYDVFNDTPETDKGLKNVVLKLCALHAAEIANEVTSDSIMRQYNPDVDEDASQNTDTSWLDVLSKDGNLATGILAQAVTAINGDLGSERQAHEQTKEHLLRARTAATRAKSRAKSQYDSLKANYEIHGAMWGQLELAEKKPCNCGLRYKIKFLWSRSSRVSRVTIECTDCKAVAN